MVDYKAVLEHYHRPVPRYTSYPTAPQFNPEIGQKVFDHGLENMKSTGPVSVYLHIPYCDRLCWFCGCHTKHTLKYAPVAKYVQALSQELELFAQKLSYRPRLGQIHLGGGSPSLLRNDELAQLKQALGHAFEFDRDTEISVEIDPSDIAVSTITPLANFGTTRASIGVQDFHPEVQKAINRPQTYETTRDVIGQLRDAGISSVNVDVLYGLPLQSESRLLRTIEQSVSLGPDRMALFGYAHVPWLKKHQKMINSADLPDSMERYIHSQSAAAALKSAGFESIGIDHFATPSDKLAVANRSGTLRRNFQGYTTDCHETMLGFGASSIGRFTHGFVQNIVPTQQYETDISAGGLAKGKGLRLSEDDRRRSYIIERLMCDFAFDFATLSDCAPSLQNEYLAEAEKIAANEPFDLCSMEGTKLVIEEGAKPFTRIIASKFDAYFRDEQYQYSKAV